MSGDVPAVVSNKGRLVLGAVIVVVIVTSFLAESAIINTIPRTIVWERDYEKAIERARAGKKIILADMFTDWCVLCKDMDRETFGDPNLIRQMAKEYVWLKLNTETEEDGKKLQEEFGITTYPTILVLDSDGEEIDCIDSFLTAEAFKRSVEQHLQDPESLGKMRERVEKTPESVELRSALGQKYLDRHNYPGVLIVADQNWVLFSDLENTVQFCATHRGRTVASLRVKPAKIALLSQSCKLCQSENQ